MQVMCKNQCDKTWKLNLNVKLIDNLIYVIKYCKYCVKFIRDF